MRARPPGAWDRAAGWSGLRRWSRRSQTRRVVVDPSPPRVLWTLQRGPFCWQLRCCLKTSRHRTAAIQAPPALALHVYEVSTYSSAAHAYRKRRSESPSSTRLRDVHFGAVPTCSVRDERRAAGLAGRACFVSIRTRPTVPRDRLPEVYRGVPGTRTKPYSHTVGTAWGGKGLTFYIQPTTTCWRKTA